MFLGDLVEDPNITLQDAFGDMLSNLRLTFLIAGKPYWYVIICIPVALLLNSSASASSWT